MQLSERKNMSIATKADKRDEAKKRQERAAQIERNDWEWLTSDERGLRILWRTMSLCGVFRAGLNANALSMSFAEGQRNVGVYLWDRLARYTPDKIPAFLTMRDEHDE